MSRKIALFCILIGLVAFTASSAYAEVQNIKVSGDITAMGVYRNNYDLEDSKIMIPNPLSETEDYIEEDQDSLFMSVVRLRIDADLTDNVAATVRLGNAREWDVVASGGTDDIILDLASITLKEMLYSPLTVIIGRQELMYGNGLIIGPGRFNDSNAVQYNDLLPFQAYDAVRATLDYDPLTVDLIYAKMSEDDDTVRDAPNAATADDRNSDIDLYGVNAAYQFDEYDAEMEGYLFYKKDPTYVLTVYQTNDDGVVTFDQNDVYTLGLRGSMVPMDNLTLNGEIAGQFGEIYNGTANPTGNDLERDREALLAYVSGEYDFADVKFNPVLGLEYLYVSGEEIGGSNQETSDTSDFDTWDPMYRGKVMGTIGDCIETLYTTNDPADQSGWTNRHTIKLSGAVDLGELVDGLSMDMAYLHYWYAEEPVSGADDDIGNEINMTLTYDYTEDVQFLLDGAWFIPGDYYDDVHISRSMTGGEISVEGVPNVVTNRVANDSAVSIVGSCKVVF